MTKEKINIEGLLEELEAIIEKMEDDNLNIEQSLSSYERGIGLVKEAQKKLTEIEKKVQILSKDDQLENNSRSIARPGVALSLSSGFHEIVSPYSLKATRDTTILKFSNEFIDNLKLVYEDFWKSQNQINTSVKLSLNISIDNSNNIKINKFEKILSDMDLIYNFSIYKFDNRNNFYKVIFNLN